MEFGNNEARALTEFRWLNSKNNPIRYYMLVAELDYLNDEIPF